MEIKKNNKKSFTNGGHMVGSIVNPLSSAAHLIVNRKPLSFQYLVQTPLYDCSTVHVFKQVVMIPPSTKKGVLHNT